MKIKESKLAVYIYIRRKKIVRTIELVDNIYVDFDKDNKVVGIEILK